MKISHKMAVSGLQAMAAKLEKNAIRMAKNNAMARKAGQKMADTITVFADEGVKAFKSLIDYSATLAAIAVQAGLPEICFVSQKVVAEASAVLMRAIADGAAQVPGDAWKAADKALDEMKKANAAFEKKINVLKKTGARTRRNFTKGVRVAKRMFQVIKGGKSEGPKE